jgi:hypothetical protein
MLHAPCYIDPATEILLQRSCYRDPATLHISPHTAPPCLLPLHTRVSLKPILHTCGHTPSASLIPTPSHLLRATTTDIFNSIFHTAAAVALIITMVLDNTIPGSPEERGLHVWQKLGDAQAEEWWHDDHMNAVSGAGGCLPLIQVVLAACMLGFGSSYRHVYCAAGQQSKRASHCAQACCCWHDLLAFSNSPGPLPDPATAVWPSPTPPRCLCRCMACLLT